MKSFYNIKEKINSKIENCSKTNLNNIFQELYKRFVIPFYIPLLALLPFLLTLLSKEDLNYPRVKVITFFLGIFFIILSETTIKMISEIILNNLVISAMPFLFLLIFYIIYFNKTNFNPSKK